MESRVENAPPITKGRHCTSECLQAYLESPAGNSLYEDLRRNAIETSDICDDDDPLKPWLWCIKWVTAACSSGVAQLKLPPLLKACTETFQTDKRYQSDLRYLRVWVQYADCCSEPGDIFVFLELNSIGQEHALFYEAYGTFLEFHRQFTKANEAYELGLIRQAQPLGRLEATYKHFLKRMVKRNKRNKLQEEQLALTGGMSVELPDAFGHQQKENCNPNAVRETGNANKLGIEVLAPVLIGHDIYTRTIEGAETSFEEARLSHWQTTIDGRTTSPQPKMSRKMIERPSHKMRCGDEEPVFPMTTLSQKGGGPQNEKKRLSPQFSALMEHRKEESTLSELTLAGSSSGDVFLKLGSTIEAQNTLIKCGSEGEIDGAPAIQCHLSPTKAGGAVGSCVLANRDETVAIEQRLVDPTIDMKEALADILSMFNKPLSFERSRPKSRAFDRKSGLLLSGALEPWGPGDWVSMGDDVEVPLVKMLPAMPGHQSENFQVCEEGFEQSKLNKRGEGTMISVLNSKSFEGKDLAGQRDGEVAPNHTTSAHGFKVFEDEYLAVQAKQDWNKGGENQNIFKRKELTGQRDEEHSHGHTCPIVFDEQIQELSFRMESVCVTSSAHTSSLARSCSLLEAQSTVAEERDEHMPSESLDPWEKALIARLLDSLDPPLREYAGFLCSDKKYSGPVALSLLKSGVRNKTLQLGPMTYHLKECTGRGAFAQVYQALAEDDNYGDNVFNVVLKVQRPSCPWEFYCYRQLDFRISPDDRCLFGYAHKMHVYADCSFMVCDYGCHGTLQDLVNVYRVLGQRMDEGLCMFYTIELLRMLEVLHGVGLIHADLKPDNLLIRSDSEDWQEWAPDRPGCWKHQGLCLIDWGRSIDTNLFSKGTQFVGDSKTDAFRCIEMVSQAPWTFQVDTYGLCGVVHCLLHGTYMEIQQSRGSHSCPIYRPKAQYKRYWNTELWRNLFETLLNVESCIHKPPLSSLRRAFEDHLVSKGLAKKLQQLLMKQTIMMSSHK